MQLLEAHQIIRCWDLKELIDWYIQSFTLGTFVFILTIIIIGIIIGLIIWKEKKLNQRLNDLEKWKNGCSHRWGYVGGFAKRCKKCKLYWRDYLKKEEKDGRK